MKKITYDPGSLYTNVGSIKTKKSSLLSKHLSITDKLGQSSSKASSRKIDVAIVPTEKFKEYRNSTKKENRQLTIIGQTKLNQISSARVNSNHGSDKTTAVLEVPVRKDAYCYFEVRDNYQFSQIIGYIPVGDDRFVAAVALNPLYLILVVIVIFGIAGGVYFITRPKEEQLIDNRYIEEANTSEIHSDQSSTRYRMNTTITVVQNTIQNLDFENINEGKYLRVKIKLDPDNDTDYIYDSELVPFGKKVTADTLLKEVPAGTYHAVAECYSYSSEKEQLSQTNINITLIVK